MSKLEKPTEQQLRPFGPALTFEERLAIIEEVDRMAKAGYSNRAIAGVWDFYHGEDGKLKARNVGQSSETDPAARSCFLWQRPAAGPPGSAYFGEPRLSSFFGGAARLFSFKRRTDVQREP